MNAGNRKKKWVKYCLNSKVLDRFGQCELRYTEDDMYVIIVFSTEGGVEETLSENIYSKEELLKMWQRWKEED